MLETKRRMRHAVQEHGIEAYKLGNVSSLEQVNKLVVFTGRTHGITLHSSSLLFKISNDNTPDPTVSSRMMLMEPRYYECLSHPTQMTIMESNFRL
jgi:23S rRNA-/tRNA-specific pseudouridylate synthase